MLKFDSFFIRKTSIICLFGINKNQINNLIKKITFKFMEKKTNFSKNIFCYNINSYQIKEIIELNEKEKKIFNLINEVLVKNNKKTTCRVAGGWVRDKLNGRENYDIDIALDDMMGEEMAKILNDEIYPGQEKFGVVNKNCEKSKHLETASMFIYGMPIDFVNLRSETYSNDSRVPVIDIGSPEQDASRRDITINALFYNIKTKLVEDFCGNGILDLKNSFVRTPIDPHITFNDDPLRILRVIRFAVRFQFVIDEVIEKAAKDYEIKDSLYKKISNERIAKEILLMLEGNLPQCSLYMLYKYNILDACLKLPLDCESLSNPNLIQMEIRNSLKLIKFGAFLLNENFTHENLIYLAETEDLSQEKKSDILKEFKKSIYLALLCFTFNKYEKRQGKEILNGGKIIYKQSLKLPNELIKEIGIFSTSVDEIIGFVNNKQNFCKNNSRLNNAKLIRRIKNPYFLKSIFLSICLENFNYISSFKFENLQDSIEFNNEFIENFTLINNFDEKILFENDLTIDKFTKISDNFYNVIDKYKNWMNYLKEEKLIHIDSLKPIFDGLTIQKILNVKSGKKLGVLMENLIEFQIANPNMTEDDAQKFLFEKKNELF